MTDSADAALQRLWSALPRARLVGGCVRDALIGAASADIDLATPDLPDAVMLALAEAGIRCIPTGLAHGTVTAIVEGRPFEITTLRRDVATDGRHAVVAFTDDWRADAARRDFSFNAMSMERDGTLHDYFDGAADLRAGRVRFVGDPAARIAEDRLRILRFFRFFARYGRTEPDAATRTALAAEAGGLDRLSGERIWSELRRILAVPQPGPALDLMAALGVLAAVMPEGSDLPALHRLLATPAPVDPVLRLAALLTGDIDRFADRLRLSGAERARLAALRAPPPPPHADDATLRRVLADTAPDIVIDRCWLAGPAWDAVRTRLATLPQPVFPLEGRDVLALGLAPGPLVGALLRDIRAWWLAGGCVADADACRAELLRRTQGGHSIPRTV